MEEQRRRESGVLCTAGSTEPCVLVREEGRSCFMLGLTKTLFGRNMTTLRKLSTRWYALSLMPGRKQCSRKISFHVHTKGADVSWRWRINFAARPALR